MPPRARFALFVLPAAFVWLSAANPASAQIRPPAGSLTTVVVLEEILDSSELLLAPPTGRGLLAELASLSTGTETPSAFALRAGRMGAYREFERGLRIRTRGIVAGRGTREERQRRWQRLVADVGDRLQGLPGAPVVRFGRRVWSRIEDTTDIDVRGYRVRLRMDEALDGRLSLKVQKQLR